MITPFRTILAVILLAVPALASPSAAQTNLAAGLAYEVSPAPNYPGADDPQRRVLTDGRHAGALWSPRDMIGWSRTAPIVLKLDLQTTRAFDEVSFTAMARPRNDLHYPAEVFLFAGLQENEMQHVASVLPTQMEEVSGRTTFRLSVTPLQARHLTLVFYPKGDFLLMDEVEVRAAADGKAVAGAITAADIVSAAARRRRQSALAQGGDVPNGPRPSRRWIVPLPEAASASGGCDMRRIDPWQTFTAKRLDRLAPAPATIIAADDTGVAHAAWLVANHGDTPAQLGSVAAGELRLKALSFVQASDLSWVADAPVAFEPVILPPGRAMLLLGEAGAKVEHMALTLSCGERRLTSEFTIRKSKASAMPRAPHGTLWPYLRGPASLHACASDLLEMSGSDTAVVPPSALTGASADGEFRLYLRQFAKARRLHLFLDLGRLQWRSGMFAPQSRRQGFKAWWLHILAVAKDEGFAGELTLYPFDEIAPKDIPELESFKAMFRDIDPSARIFGTIDKAASARAIESLDIVQVLNKPAVVALPTNGKEKHIYATLGDARQLSPYSYYRLQGWTAYNEAAAGTGFWSLWETSGADDPQSGWSLFGGDERDYGVIYSDEDGCPFASRRLQGWRRGREDYRILVACEGVIGKQAMQAHVRRVLARPEDVSAADEALAAIDAQCQR